MPAANTRFERIGGAELLFPEGDAALPFVCIASAALAPGEAAFGLRLCGRLLADVSSTCDALLLPAWTLPANSPQAAAASRLADLLARVFAAQNADGDWPQWFIFFERERHGRADDSHGDVVFWPLLGLARYLLASGDASLLDLILPVYTKAGVTPEQASVWQHVERALAVIAGRHIEGTALVAYGHGDWNDSLQPADPALRERLCSAWTGGRRLK